MILALAMPLVTAATVTVERREVTLGDVLRRADGTRFAGKDAALVVLRLPVARRRMMVPAESLATLVRRRLSHLAIASTGPTTITLRAPTAPHTGCWTTIRALAVGDPVTTRDVTATPCADGERAALRMTGDGAMALTAARPAGTALGRFLPVPATRIATGTALTLRSVHGPVAIERPVTTMQPGRSGKHVFVRDERGQVFAAPLVVAEDVR